MSGPSHDLLDAVRGVREAAERAVDYVGAGVPGRAREVVADAETSLREALADARRSSNGAQPVDDDPEPGPPPSEHQQELQARRLRAAMIIAADLLAAEALARGEPVPASQLDPTWRELLSVDGELVLDEATERRIELLRRDHFVRDPRGATGEVEWAHVRSWQPVNLAEPDFAKPTEPPVVLFLYRGKRIAIVGPPEALKTLLGLIAALEWTRAGHGRFALIDFEMGPHATRLLLEDLGASPEEIADVYYLVPEAPPTERDLEAMLAAGVTLVLYDAAAGAYDASGLDDNKRGDVERFGRIWIRPLWQRGCTTLTLDHVVKATEARGRFAIGSERKLGGVDVQIGLESVKQLHRGATGIVELRTLKDRPGHLPRPHVGQLHVASDPETHRIEWDFREPEAADQGQPFRPTILMGRASIVLQTAGEPLSRTELAKRFTGKREYRFAAIDRLIAEGYAAVDGHRVRHVRLFTRDEESDSVVPPAGNEAVPPVPPGSQAGSPGSPPPGSPPVPAPLQGAHQEPGTDGPDQDEVERLAALAEQAHE